MPRKAPAPRKTVSAQLRESQAHAVALECELEELRDQSERDGMLQETLDISRAERESLRRQLADAQQRAEAAQSERQMLQMAIRSLENERDQARAHAESMRQQAFPAPPAFPWEPRA